MAIGHDPATKIFKEQIEMDAEGYVITQDQTLPRQISREFLQQVMLKTKYIRQAVTAAGMGCMAALEAEKFLSGNHN